MHSRIFEVVRVMDNNEQAVTTSELNESFFYDYDGDKFFDYVSDLSEKGVFESFRWIKGAYPGLFRQNVSNDAYIIDIKEQARLNYFKEKYETLKQKVNCMSLEEFANVKYFSVFQIQQLIDEQYSFYIYEDSIVLTLDNWLRECNDGESYLLVNALDYHC